jgi:mannosylglycoprotein endo-beta-mannosidase
VAGRMWDWSLEPTAALYAAQNANEPLHPQFDYLKNTVSVVNDYYRSFENCLVTVEVYDLQSKRVLSRLAKIPQIPEDGVLNDILQIDFPAGISSVHFIKLRLFDESNRQVGSNFYWRSNSRYEGKNTLTGPTTAGFQDINQLPETTVKAEYETQMKDGKHFIDLHLKNTGKGLSFFTQVQWLDGEGKPVRPSFYTDNFVNLLPGERRKITIETGMSHLQSGKPYFLVIKGFNIREQRFEIKFQEI